MPDKVVCKKCLKRARIKLVLGLVSLRACVLCGSRPSYLVSQKTYNWAKFSMGVSDA